MIELALDGLSDWGGLAVRWTWQAGIVALVALAANLLLGPRAPRLRLTLLALALLRFAVPPIVGSDLATAIPQALTGPAENGLELMVADAHGTRALAWPAWLLLLAAGGSLVRLAVLARQSVGLRRLHRTAVKADAVTVQRARDLARRLGLRRTPDILISDAAASPFVAGWRRPMVVLPRTVAESLPVASLGLIVAHELVHLRHRDVLVNHAVAALGVVWWFHPLFQWLAAAFEQLREERCDRRVVEALEAPRASYARALVEAAALCRPQRSWAGAAALFSLRAHPLETRLRRLARPGVSGGPAATVLTYVVLALAAFGFAGAVPSTGVPHEEAPEGVSNATRRVVFVHQGASSTAHSAPLHDQDHHAH